MDSSSKCLGRLDGMDSLVTMSRPSRKIRLVAIAVISLVVLLCIFLVGLFAGWYLIEGYPTNATKLQVNIFAVGTIVAELMLLFGALWALYKE